MKITSQPPHAYVLIHAQCAKLYINRKHHLTSCIIFMYVSTCISIMIGSFGDFTAGVLSGHIHLYTCRCLLQTL